METRINGVVTIRGFIFDWIPFLNLTGLFCEQGNDLRRFNCVNNRYGVYFFFDKSGNVPYVGRVKSRDLPERIQQYFTFSLSKTGNTFGKYWIEKNYPTYQDINQPYQAHFKPYIERHRLGTLSTVGPCNDSLMGNQGVLDDMEKFFICKLQPDYNAPCYSGLTDNEQDNLMSALFGGYTG